MKTKIFSFLSFVYVTFCLFPPLHAQYSNIQGKISDEQMKPLAYVTVRLTTPDSIFIQGNTTDTLGGYTLTGVGSGDYLLFFSFIGYEPQALSLRMENKDRTIQEIILKSGSMTLSEVEVKGQSFIQQEDRVLIIPEKQQVRHSYTGYDLLYNLMIPGVDVDKQTGVVSNFRGEVTLYIDGNEVGFREVQNLRARDIEKVEYFDIPIGKYAKDKGSINYITKKYTSGGYVSINTKQTIGYLNGDYNASAKITKKKTSFSLWGGYCMQSYEGTQSVSNETYTFPEYKINKYGEMQDGLSRTNRQYIQVNAENLTERHTLVAKVGFTRNAMPEEWQELQTLYSGHYNHEERTRIVQNQIGLMPSLNLYGYFKIKDNQSLETRMNGSYSNTIYERTYNEGDFHSYTNVDEDHYRYSGNLNYVLQMKQQQTLSIDLSHSKDISITNYKGDYNQSQHFWEEVSFLLLMYTIKTKKFSFNIQPSIVSVSHHLQRQKTKHFLSPQFAMRLTYRPTGKQFFEFWGSIHNGLISYNWLNDIEQKVDSIMIKRGNQDQPLPRQTVGILGYGLQVASVNFKANASYCYTDRISLPYYIPEGDKMINSFWGDNIIHLASTSLGVTWKASSHLHFKLDGDYNYVWVFSDAHYQLGSWSGSFQINYYWKALGVNAFVRSPSINFGLDMIFSKIPINYGLSVNYSYKGFRFELGTNAPFSKDLYRINYQDISTHYSYERVLHDRTYQQMGWVKVAYSFDFGRKTARSSNDISTDIQSTILKVN